MRVKLDKIVHYNKGERGRVAVIVLLYLSATWGVDTFFAFNC